MPRRPESPPDEILDEPGPLTPEGLFTLVLDECFRDGLVDPVENLLLNQLAQRLDLPEARLRELAEGSALRLARDELGPPDALERHRLLLRVEVAMEADGVLGDQELELLEELRELLDDRGL